MTIQVTAETTPTNAELERRLGTVLFQQIKPHLDAAQAAPAVIDRLTPDDAHARASRTAAIEQRIESAIEEKRAILEAKHQCFRTSALCKYIGKRDDREPPTREVIQRVLKKHGLYT